jgi:chromosome segregation ATPase
VNLTQFSQNQLALVCAVIGFIAGLMLMRAFFKPKQKEQTTEDPRNHQIRELEADLRAAKRELGDCEEALEEKTEEFNTSVETSQELRATLAERDARLDELQGDLKGSVAKTRELRTELQDRATATVREQVRATEAETELEVARAGNEAVMSEITRLQEEQKSLTDTMQNLGDVLLPDEELFKD